MNTTEEAKKEWIKEIIETWLPADHNVAERAVKKLYKGRKAPKIVWVADPYEGKKLAQKRKEEQFIAPPYKELQARVLATKIGSQDIPYNKYSGEGNIIAILCQSITPHGGRYWPLFLLACKTISQQYQHKVNFGDLTKLHESCGAFWLFQNTVILTECISTPPQIDPDSDNRPFRDGRILHCETGPALAFPNGKEWYYWHGHSVPKQVILAPHKLDPTKIKNERNAETKRIMIERFGWVRYIEHVDAKLIDERKNEIEGTKEALIWVETEQTKLLICGYRSKQKLSKIYAMEVPETVNTCEEAQLTLSSGLSSRTISAS